MPILHKILSIQFIPFCIFMNASTSQWQEQYSCNNLFSINHLLTGSCFKKNFLTNQDHYVFSWMHQLANDRSNIAAITSSVLIICWQGLVSKRTFWQIKIISRGEIFKKWDEPFKKVSLWGFYIFGILRISRSHFCVITFDKGGGIF